MHDLFIHYVEPDRDWVDEHLLNPLRERGVRCLSEAGFAPGVPKLQELEDAIRRCRRTLLVLSPTYLADNFGRMADLLASSYGLEKGNWPVIPLLRHSVALPPHLDLLVQIDATEPARWPQVLDRL